MFKSSIHFHLIALFLPTVSCATAATVPSETYTHPNQLITIQGHRRINLFCMGTGKPVVLLNSGLGGNIIDWRHVQAQIANFTRVCAYDRAGYGFSDAASRPSDAVNAADDLNRLIIAANLKPVLYVGHSIAGIYGAYLEAVHPDDIIGAVLVDPSFAEQDDWARSLSPKPRAAFYTELASELDGQEKCLDLSKTGALTNPKTDTARQCVDMTVYPDHLDPALEAELTREWTSPKVNAANLSEMASIYPNSSHESIDSAEIQSIRFSFYAKPLIVLTHVRWEPYPGVNAQQLPVMAASWNTGHDALARTSTQGVNIAVPNSGHYIQIDQPAVVIAAVKKVVSTIRHPSP
jgi:pimeloyl-ACP methyl ester carboxylesterase